ncbi:MAG: non-canonical purine NTP pyrophosphatase, RdgB/HAM1 family [Candidatus Methanomethylicota archaeon]|nr:MAG: non-canonical purine NTP pyrophosphatase, RdgB/HAM1 family [Candidatus Verstraetearchaeota archaeon]
MSGEKLYFVTSNKHKFLEASHILSIYHIELEMLNIGKLEIQSDSLAEIALFAAKDAFKRIRKPLLVEDAGLFIKCLKGFPGPFSSYVYKTIGVNGILRLMEGLENREAYFESAVVFCSSPQFCKVFRRRIHGYISLKAKGSGGFGFDPIFIPKGGDGSTFAELSLQSKCSLSHRGIAFKAFGEWYNRYFRNKFKYFRE